MKTFVKIFQAIMFGSVICVAFLSLLAIGVEPQAGHWILTGMMICLCIMITYMVAAQGCKLLPYSWTCDLAGTHFPNGESSFDGASNHSVCKKCDKEVMQDSQGNWF